MREIQVPGGVVEVSPTAPPELDFHVPYNPPPKFVVKVDVEGSSVSWDYDYSQPAPDRPPESYKDATPGTVEYAQWKMWTRHQQALAARRDRIDYDYDYAKRVTEWVLTNKVKVVGEAEITADKYPDILAASVLPELTMEEISATLADIFRRTIKLPTARGPG